MYGMVNQAIKKMIVEQEGENFWLELCSQAAIPEKDFVAFQQYDDELTLNMVLKVCELTGKSTQEILVAFGRYWIHFAFRSEYREILQTFSESPVSLIKSLNGLHDMLEQTFEQLKSPSFDTVEETTNKLVVNYYSDREMPLEFFVVGLFEGIFEHFDQKCNVEIVDTLGQAKATFQIHY